MKYTFEVEMLNLDDKIEVEIEAENPLARDTFFKKFLERKDELYFKDKKTDKTYNKQYIYSYILKGE